MEEIDRISSLHDFLLHHILSFLKTKESVKTSLLSKRWINLWKSVPSLNLDASDFTRVSKFEKFVSFVLYQRLFPIPEQIHTLDLTWQNCHESNLESDETINVWMYNLISLKPRMVNIDLSNLYDISFVSHLFNCSSLESLFLSPKPDLNNNVYAHLFDINPMVINLPRLKNFNLQLVTLQPNFFERLILGCPVLEKLTLENCILDSIEKIMSSSVKILIMLNTECVRNTRLRVCMPNLEYLSCAFRLGLISFQNLESLEYARVNIWAMENDYDGKEVKLLRGLSNAKTIELCGYYVNEMLEKESADLPIFGNLKNLVLDSFNISTDLKPIDSLLTRAPNLEKLTLQNIKMEKRRNLEQRMFNEVHCYNLKAVEIVRPDKNGVGVNNMVHSLVLHLKNVTKIIINEEDASSYFA
ncbi:hypothetical protein LUZ60_005515 [Juncus effusus]|nr:hypothetical protein LUZ60_005515 [Juncus effusus]